MKRWFLALLLVCACAKSERRSVIFIGLDGADWRIVDRFAADGTMPALAKLMRSSDRRVLLTQHPALSPIVWTTMMTGVSPLEHRILDFTRFDPVTREREPITSDERAVPAIWNMATARGKKVGVFGMWATDPPEAGVIFPKPSRTATRGSLLMLFGGGGSLPFEQETEVTRRKALEWIKREKPDLAIVYFQGTDEIAHLVDGDVESARPFYARIDQIVDEFRQLAESQHADLIIASDHGFDWGGKHERSSTATATAAKWHRDEGIFLHWSPAEVRATSSRPANVQQVCATLLALLELPHDDRLAPPIDGVAVRSDETVDYRRSFHRVRGAPAHSPAQNREAIASLQALGYIGTADPSRAPANTNTTRTPASFVNEGLILAELRGYRPAARPRP